MENQNIGKVVQIIGPVLDIRFKQNSLPNLLNAIKIDLNVVAGAGSVKSSAGT